MKFILSGLYKQFIKNVGRSPDASELNTLRKQALDIEQSDKIIQFPKSKKSLDKFKASEDAYEQSKKIKLGVDPKLTELENIKKIKVENKEAAKRFSNKMNKNKTVEDFIKDGDYDPSGMASGGLAYMLGEEPRSEYNAGGGAGAPPVTYGPPVQKQTQVAGNPRHEQLIKEAQELEILKKKAQGNFREEPGNMNFPLMGGLQTIYDRPKGTIEGSSISDLGQAIGDVAAPPLGIGYLNTGKDYEAGIQAYPNKIGIGGLMRFAEGGRIGFKKGSKKSLGSRAKELLLGSPDTIKYFGGIDAMDQMYQLLGLPGLYADGGRAGYSKGKLVKELASLIDKGRRKFLKTTGAAAAGVVGAKTGLFGFKKAAPKAVEDIKITMGNEFDGDMDADGMKYGITQAYQYLTPLTKKGKQIYNDLIKKKKISKDGNITDSEDAAMIVDDLVKNKKIKLKIGVDDASYHANKEASQTFTSETADQIKNNALSKASGLTDDFGGYGPTKFVDEFHEEIVEMVAPKIARSKVVKKVKDSVTARLKNMYDARNRKQSGGLANLLGE